MTDEQKSSIAALFAGSREWMGHIEQAAFHLHEATREYNPKALGWADSDENAHRTDARYRAIAAHRDGIASVRICLVERVATSLAVLDGYIWPECSKGISPHLPPAQYEAICATRRQRYLFMAGQVMSEIRRYLELGTDTEAQRQAVVAGRAERTAEDRAAVTRWNKTREGT